MKRLFLTILLCTLTTEVVAKNHIVRIITEDALDIPYSFSPLELRIKPGDEVTFINSDRDSHDITFMEIPEDFKGDLPSRTLKPKKKTSYRLKVPGTYNYDCRKHFGQFVAGESAGGTIVVGKPSDEGKTKRLNLPPTSKDKDSDLDRSEK